MLLRGFELPPPALDRILGAGKGAQHRRHVGQVAQLEAHIAGVTGRGRPDVGMAQRVRDRAIPAGTLAEHAAAPGTAAAEAPLDGRQHLLQQEILPGADRSRVDVLVAAEPGEAIGKGDDDRRHALLADQPVEPFRQVFAETGPIGMRQAAAGEADQIHEQRQSLSVMPGRNVDVDGARRRIAEHVAFERLALDRNPDDRTRRPEKLSHAQFSCFCAIRSADKRMLPPNGSFRLRRHGGKAFLAPSRFKEVPMIRFTFNALWLALSLLPRQAAVAGMIDSPECRRDLAMADQLIHAVRIVPPVVV